MVYQRVRPYLHALGLFTKGFLIGLPVVVTFVENVGSVKGVYGISMQPTLNPYPRRSSDSVLVNYWAVRRFEGIDRGDIVTLIDPTDPGSVLIKRVIALEGDHVRSISYKKKIVKIPRGHCWVEGDNHSHSLDSNSFGPVAVGLIQGKATHVVWPPKRWQRLENFTSDDRLASDERNLTVSESENVQDTLNDVETGGQQNGISNTCRSYGAVDDSSSVTEFMYGPTS